MRYIYLALGFGVNCLAFWVLILLVSCSPQKRINRIVKKNPELVRVDTIQIIDTIKIQGFERDTVTTFVKHDSVTVFNNDTVILRYFYDTITNNIYHYIRRKPDTIIRVKNVPYENIVIKNDWKKILKDWSWLIFFVILVYNFYRILTRK